MERIPFGVRRLDTAIGGGAPPGSVVLLSGEAGAGSREFSYTAAAMSGLSFADSELFTLYYGSEQSMPVEEVHYISLSASERQIRKEMKLVMDDEIVDEGLSPVTFHDLSPEFFRLSPVPREWYADRTIDISQLGESQQRSGIAEALGNRLTRHAPGNLVVIDSLSDLAGTETE
ncbi:MAG: HTR-like protein, partial [Natronomonas sp.]